MVKRCDCLKAVLMVAVIMTADPAFAAGVDTQIGSVLCTVTGWFTGNVGKGLATLAILIVGVWKLLGRISGQKAIQCAWVLRYCLVPGQYSMPQGLPPAARLYKTIRTGDNYAAEAC